MDLFVEEFIRRDGIGKIVSLTRMPDTRSLVLAIKCLQYALIYLNGVEYLRKKPHFIMKLYDLVAHPEAEVRKNVI